MKKLLTSQRGFTLVELMVVVAIIAILSTIAIPNFRNFQAKAKTSEAKLHLSSIYSAEVAFLSDADVYASCLSDMGYNPTAQSAQRYFSTGFGTSAGDETGFYVSGTTEINGVPCTGGGGDGISFFVAGKTTSGKDVIEEDGLEDTYMGTDGDAFRAAAQGWISAAYIKEYATNSPVNTILDSILSPVYAQGNTETAFANCAAATDGTSLFTINEEKSLRTVCQGFGTLVSGE